MWPVFEFKEFALLSIIIKDRITHYYGQQCTSLFQVNNDFLGLSCIEKHVNSRIWSSCYCDVIIWIFCRFYPVPNYWGFIAFILDVAVTRQRSPVLVSMPPCACVSHVTTKSRSHPKRRKASTTQRHDVEELQNVGRWMKTGCSSEREKEENGRSSLVKD